MDKQPIVAKEDNKYEKYVTEELVGELDTIIGQNQIADALTSTEDKFVSNPGELPSGKSVQPESDAVLTNVEEKAVSTKKTGVKRTRKVVTK